MLAGPFKQAKVGGGIMPQSLIALAPFTLIYEIYITSIVRIFIYNHNGFIARPQSFCGLYYKHITIANDDSSIVSVQSF